MSKISCHKAAVRDSRMPCPVVDLLSLGLHRGVAAQGQKEKKLAAEIANGRLAMMAPSSVLSWLKLKSPACLPTYTHTYVQVCGCLKHLIYEHAQKG